MRPLHQDRTDNRYEIKKERERVMEEKVLITSERYTIKKVFTIILIVGIFLSAIMLWIELGDEYYQKEFDYDYSCYLNHRGRGYCRSWEPAYRCTTCRRAEWRLTRLALCLTPIIVFALLGGLSYFWLRSYELIVTDKRVYGRVAFGKRVDLPVDSISSTATIRIFKGISVATSSGKISFLAIKNADEIYEIASNLLIERQREKAKEVAPVTIAQSDEADQLRKYKDLLDSGVITQEEFDAKKKQLLGL